MLYRPTMKFRWYRKHNAVGDAKDTLQQWFEQLNGYGGRWQDIEVVEA